MANTTFNQLTEIPGIDATDVGLLHAAGIHNLHDLAHARADNLAAQLEHLREAHGLEQEAAAGREVDAWIRKARQLDPLTVANDDLQQRLAEAGDVLTLDEWEEYVRKFPPPTAAQMKLIVDQTLLVIEQMYVHLGMKRARRAIDPAQSLRLLRQRIEDDTEHWQFHEEMLKILKSLGDIHTAYRLPPPYRHSVAFLPMLVQKCYERLGDDADERFEPHFVVTRTLWKPSGDMPLKVGDEIVSWNGVPMPRAVDLCARDVEGANESAARAFGLQFMTMRWLGAAFQPESPWVIVGYRNEHGHDREIRLPWRIIVLKPDQDKDYMTRAQYLWFMFNPSSGEAPDDAGFNPSLQIANVAAMKIFKEGSDASAKERHEARSRMKAVRSVVRKGGRKERLQDIGKDEAADAEQAAAPRLESNLKEYLDVEELSFQGKNYGYIGIRAFPFAEPGQADRETDFVLEFRRLLAHMPANGLIIDVRGNPGGSIPNAEMLLQLLCARDIEPLPFQFIASPLTREITETNRGLDRWRFSVDMAVRTGAPFSQGVPLTAREDVNYWGQEYFGPVVLLTSATSYSAADHFSASFADHKVGHIIGVDRTTGGGGANVWFFSRHLLPKLPAALRQDIEKDWPGDVNLQFAARRVMRIKQSTGLPIEEIGVCTPRRRRYHLTRDDLLDGEKQLRDFAMDMLSKQPHFDLAVRADPDGKQGLIEVSALNMDWIDCYQNGRLLSSRTTENDAEGRSQLIRFELPGDPADPGLVELHGMKRTRRGVERVARYKHRAANPPL